MYKKMNVKIFLFIFIEKNFIEKKLQFEKS
jgi:hypothetical protein